MGNRIFLPSGYTIKVTGNQETVTVTVIGEGEKPAHTITSSSVKPFVNGGLAWLLTQSLSYSVTACLLRSKFFSYNKSQAHFFFKRMPGIVLCRASYTSLLVGSFDVLTRKVKAANEGMPLTIFQEACCALKSGAIAACVAVPFSMAVVRMEGNRTCPSILQYLYHKAANEGVLALWKGRGPLATATLATAMITTKMVMLVAYNRCYGYLRESVGLNETGAILGAGAVSGFFARACSSSSLNCAFKIFKLEGRSAFIVNCQTVAIAPTITLMVFWLLYGKLQSPRNLLILTPKEGKNGSRT